MSVAKPAVSKSSQHCWYGLETFVGFAGQLLWAIRSSFVCRCAFVGGESFPLSQQETRNWRGGRPGYRRCPTKCSSLASLVREQTCGKGNRSSACPRRAHSSFFFVFAPKTKNVVRAYPARRETGSEKLENSGYAPDLRRSQDTSTRSQHTRHPKSRPT